MANTAEQQRFNNNTRKMTEHNKKQYSEMGMNLHDVTSFQW